MSYQPANANGPALAINSAPVVVATDDVLSTDLLVATVLDEIRAAVMALAGAKGILADLRVTVLNPTGTAVTITSGTVTTVSSVTNLAQVGGVTANSVVQDWENQTYNSAFSVNITRP